MSLAIVTGSGIRLEQILDSATETVTFAAAGLPEGSVAGHDCKFVLGNSGDTRIILQCGRLHIYEGHGHDAASRTIDCLRDFGARAVLFINAAGGLMPEMAPGDLLAVERLRTCRYAPWDATPGMVMTDFQVPDCDFAGTYHWVPGPSYETRAEIAALQNMGSAAVGMSTAPEFLRCKEFGIPAGVISCITNSCSRNEPLSHEQVIAAANRASAKIADLIRKSLPDMPRAAR